MKKILTVLFIAVLPTISFAASNGGLNGLIEKVTGILGNLYVLLLAAIGVAFAWGVLKFVFKSGDESESGKSMMIWSIVAITILASVYGIVGIVQESAGIEDNDANIFPGLPTANTSN